MRKIALLFLFMITNYDSLAKEIDHNERIKMNILNIGIPKMPKTLDPRDTWVHTNFFIIQSIYQTLVRVDANGEIVSYLAEYWTISKDKTEYKFYINKNAKFSNGNRVTADDVAFSFSRHFWSESNSAVKDYIESILVKSSNKEGKYLDGIKVNTDREITFKLTKPYPSFLKILAMPSYSIISKEAYEKEKKIIGSGPMEVVSQGTTLQLKKQQFNSSIKLEMNEFNFIAYQKDELIPKLIEDNKIDLILGSVVKSEFKLPPKYKFTKVDTLSHVHMFYNLNTELFQDHNFRKDLSALIYWISNLEGSLLPFQERQYTYIPKGVLPKEYYNKNKIELHPDEFLKIWNVKNQVLELALIEDFLSEKFIKNLVLYLEKVGFNVKLKDLNNNVVEVLKNRNYTLLSDSYIGNFSDPDGFLDPLIGDPSFRSGNFPVEKLRKEILEVKHDLDDTRRLENYSKILSKFEDNWYFVPLFRMNFPFIHSTDLNIPDVSYRYEAELWNIVWKNK